MSVLRATCRAVFGAAALIACGTLAASAQVPLSAYQDPNGFINLQALTCTQLINTYQEDADLLAAWYSGWYNGLAQKHFAHITRVRPGEHQLILYCRAHPELKIIEAISILLKAEQAR